jgi:hypothetical protein
MAGFKDELNNEYGFLKVVEFSHFAYRRSGRRFCPLACWRAECRCGNFVVVRGADLRNGHVKSCSCLKKETSAESILVNRENSPSVIKGRQMRAVKI